MKKFGNIITIALICWVVSKELGLFNPLVGVELKSQTFKRLETQEILTLPDRQNAILIYWASWCAPCKLEMSRLKNADIDHKRVFAINLSESAETIKKFISKNKQEYPFSYIIKHRPHSDSFARKLKVSVTPSVFHVRDEKITWAREGMSLFGILRAEFLIPKENR